MTTKLDSIDLQILKELQANGKITNLQLSKEVGLSPAPTLERVRKLEKNGVITSFHAKVDEAKVGLGIQAVIHVSLTRQIQNAIDNFVVAITEIDEIIECLQVTGTFDYQLKVMVKNIKAFDDLISGKLSKIEEIRKMQTFVILSTVKSSNVLPF